MKKIIIDNTGGGQRLDKFLSRYMPAAPKSTIHKLVRKKVIIVNERKTDASYILETGDVITLFLADDTIAKFVSQKAADVSGVIDIIYEDDHILFANKPANLLTQPDARAGDSLLGRVRAHCDSDVVFKPVAVNRIDRNTTGIAVFAKTVTAAQILSKIFHDRDVDKYYLAVICGELRDKKRLEGAHSKDEAKNKAEISGEGDKISITEVYPIGYSLKTDTTTARIKLITGHSHQIRAHMLSINHPIVGDPKYGRAGASPRATARRQLLHAHEIHFPKAWGALEYLRGQTFAAPIPADILKFTP